MRHCEEQLRRSNPSCSLGLDCFVIGPAKPDPLARNDATYPCTALAKLAKNSSASFLADPLMSRCPSCASLPPICASTSYLSSVPPSFSVSPTVPPPLAKPATPPSPSPERL